MEIHAHTRSATWQVYGASERPPGGVLALGPVRGAAASIRHVIALPELATDMVVVVDDLDDYHHRCATYHEIFCMLGAARRPVILAPRLIDDALADQLRTTYELARTWPSQRRAHGMLPAAAGPDAKLGEEPADEILGELMHTFEPRRAARVERPAVFLLRDRGRPAWLEV
jgi:hypothetical protein